MSRPEADLEKWRDGYVRIAAKLLTTEERLNAAIDENLALRARVEALTLAVLEYEKRLGIPNFASLAVVPVEKQP